MTSAAQTWTLIGIVGAFASLALTMTMFSFQSLTGLMEAKFEAVSRRFDSVDRRLDAVDRDVQALTNRVFRDRP